jgi:hypothetical protein
MPNYRAQVTIPMFSTLPADVVTNTLHFLTLTPTALDEVADAVTPLIADMYEAIYASGRSMGDYMRPALATVNWYDLGQPPPRVPYTLPLGATIPVTATAIPTEVSCVMSFQGAPLPGVPQARRRGRIYLPGISNPWMTVSSTGSFPILSAGAVSAVAAQAGQFRTAVLATAARWAVWSTVDASMTEITNGWVDNTPDTQRRRGVEATARTLWPA